MVTENPSLLRAQKLVGLLVESGVRDWVYCPGSRCAPLGYVLWAGAQAGVLRLYVRSDERVGAFTALGLSKAGRRGAVVTTSGSALANCFPAVVEGAHSGIDFIVLSADRPASLRFSGANQCLDQLHFFGSYARFLNLDLDWPVAGQVANPLAQAQYFSPPPPTLNPRLCPTHLNIEFSPPLEPFNLASFTAENVFSDLDWPKSLGDAEQTAGPPQDFWPEVPGPAKTDSTTLTEADHRKNLEALEVLENLEAGEAVVFAGYQAPASLEAFELVKALNLPVFAEPSSVWRTHPNAVLSYGQILAASDCPKISTVYQLGRSTISRPVSQLLAQVPHLQVVAHNGIWQSESHNVHKVWPDLSQFCAHLSRQETLYSRVRLETWQQVGRAKAIKLSESDFFHYCAAKLWNAPGALMIGASGPMRYFNAVAGLDGVGRREKVFSNRGLSGIDGLIATASGVAAATGATRLALGDQSFMYDASALAWAVDETRLPLQIVVFDNAGGRIFDQLEHGKAPINLRKRIFHAPPAAKVENLAHAYGIPTLTISTGPELAAALDLPLDAPSLLRIVQRQD